MLVLLGVAATGWLAAERENSRLAATLAAQHSQPEPPREPPPAPPARPEPEPVAPAPAEQVEVLVAAKDLPVGTLLDRDTLGASVKPKKLPKEALPPARVTDLEELVGKRLSRTVREGETFNPRDLVKGGGLTLPAGHSLVSLEVPPGNSTGFVGPGSRVDVIATARVGGKLTAFPVLVDALVVAVDTLATTGEANPKQYRSTFSLAVTEKQANALILAKRRGCPLELLLRGPGAGEEAAFDLDAVIKQLSGDAVEVAPPPRAAGEAR